MAQDKDTVTLLAGGDVGPIYEPTDQFAELILPHLQQADLRFAQCERNYSERSVVLPDANAPRGPQGKRSGPQHPRMASIYKTAGIDIISLASNHTGDWGPEVLSDTVELFRSMGKHPIGAGKDIAEARKPAIVERKGMKIAFLAYCSVLPEGHEAREGKAGAAPMRARTYYQHGGDPHEDYQPGMPPIISTVPYKEDLDALLADIKKVKQQADIVVMSIHWGIHHVPKTISDYQPVVAHAAIDAGADLILGHHPHILKGIEVYKGKVCFYSIGNFMTTGGSAAKGIVEPKLWNFYHVRTDPECLPPNGKFRYPADSRKTMIAKAVFSKKGVEKVSFLPAFINPQAQPAVVAPGDPKFEEILKYMEWLSDQYPTKLRVDGNEILVTPA